MQKSLKCARVVAITSLKSERWIMDMYNIKNAKLTWFAFAMPPSCFWGGENCFRWNPRAHYLAVYLSQGGKSLIFILPLNLCLCNLSGTRVSCLILFSIMEREYIIQSLHLYFHLLGNSRSLISTSKCQPASHQRMTQGPSATVLVQALWFLCLRNREALYPIRQVGNIFFT